MPGFPGSNLAGGATANAVHISNTVRGCISLLYLKRHGVKVGLLNSPTLGIRRGMPREILEIIHYLFFLSSCYEIRLCFRIGHSTLPHEGLDPSRTDLLAQNCARKHFP